MTTRPGEAATAHWMENRLHRPCNLVKIVREDGETLTFSDSDRTLTFEGDTYIPALFAGMSADRREVGMKTSDQDLHGIIDNSRVLIADLNGNRFRGADVYHVVTDWKLPWYVIARHYKKIRNVEWDENRWVAHLHGQGQIFERPAGGRFGGSATKVCPYVLGGRHCKKDISADIRYGVKVATVIDSRIEFTLHANSFVGSFTDDYYRDGEIEWKWAPPDYEGNATIGATSLTQSPDPGWTVDEHVGKHVLVVSAATDGALDDRAIITANTSDTLTFETLPLGAPGVSDYEIAGPSSKIGSISPILYHFNATKKITLFFPTYEEIVVGERGHLRPGCNGLFSVCVEKFANGINFGGEHLQPGASDILEAAQ